MNKELAQYINTLLAEKEREVSSRQNYLDEIYKMPAQLIDTVTGERTNLDPERHFSERQELSWERSIIYRCQKAMDYFEEEDV
tara:strand:- start:129 stop:377 length:249 start_codon:yes stop_codon:yes gene_type:complete